MAELEETIFAVKIDRSRFELELIKKPTNDFEQAALEKFLESYVKALTNLRVEEIHENYLAEHLNEDSNS